MRISSPNTEQDAGNLTCDIQRGRAFITAMLVGRLAGVFTTVILIGHQQLERGTAEATDDAVLVTLFELVAVLKPLKAHIGRFLGFTLKLGAAAQVDFHRNNPVLEDRFHCEGERRRGMKTTFTQVEERAGDGGVGLGE